MPPLLDEIVLDHLRFLYAEQAPRVAEQLARVVQNRREQLAACKRPGLDHRDAVLITYADQVQEDALLRQAPSAPPEPGVQAPEPAPLEVLDRFLHQVELDGLLSTVHLLPFFPYSSDDGFSVIDYYQVHPEFGTWDHVARLGRSFQLMFDLVINHISRHSAWFQGYLRGEEPYRRYFIEVDPGADLSQVVRPRSLPLLTRVETSRGPRWVWTTFSPDQVDLNYHEPQLLVQMIDVALFYLAQGARILRLDAIAYLWKELGTPCIHLPQTHRVVKLLRTLVDRFAPGAVLLTETNVPHRENVSYFGQGDEAHMVYQFSLPPLLLDAVLNQDPGPLRRWLLQLEPPPAGCTFFNFTASHDGVGVRPLEGLVSEERFMRLIQAVKKRGGHVSTRRLPDGSDAPYELNITYFDAVGEPGISAQEHVRRFLLTQAVMLALQGVPGIYFHSLVATPNYHQGVQQRGYPRAINRRKYGYRELLELLTPAQGAPRQVLEGFRRLLAARRSSRAFSPWATQRVLEAAPESVLALLRRCQQSGQQALMAANFSAQPARLELASVGGEPWRDMLSGRSVQGSLELEGFGFCYLSQGPPAA